MQQIANFLKIYINKWDLKELDKTNQEKLLVMKIISYNIFK